MTSTEYSDRGNPLADKDDGYQFCSQCDSWEPTHEHCDAGDLCRSCWEDLYPGMPWEAPEE